MDRTLTLRIILESPPAGVDYALQQGRGRGGEPVQTQRSDGRDLRFEFPAEPRTSGDAVDFRGPFVQGPPRGRFVYINIGTAAGQRDTPWSRRLKVPLTAMTGITPAAIRRATESADAILEARVAGTGRDGTPACASVKDFGGWHVASGGGLRPSRRGRR